MKPAYATSLCKTRTISFRGKSLKSFNLFTQIFAFHSHFSLQTVRSRPLRETRWAGENSYMRLLINIKSKQFHLRNLFFKVIIFLEKKIIVRKSLGMYFLSFLIKKVFKPVDVYLFLG